MAAMTYFHSLQRLYKGKAESLFAAQSVYACWQLFGSSSAIRQQTGPLVQGAIRTALQDLKQIPTEHDDEIFLSGPNPRSREQWQQLLHLWERDIGDSSRHGNPPPLPLLD